MKVKNTYPPNFDLICAALNPPPDVLYCYGDTIYNPAKREITPDLEHHEYIHSGQQGDNPELWWNRYLTEPSFRLSQELAAYRAQYQFAKDHGITGKLLNWVKQNMATALSGEAYGNLISYGEAESKIKNYGAIS